MKRRALLVAFYFAVFTAGWVLGAVSAYRWQDDRDRQRQNPLDGIELTPDEVDDPQRIHERLQEEMP